MIKYFSILFFLINTCILAQNNINSNFDNARNHVYYLASDSLKGRNTGELGQKLAAFYIAKHFEEFNLETSNLNSKSNPYFQEFAIFKNFAFIKMPSIDEKHNIHKVLKSDFLVFGSFNKKNFINSSLILHDEFGNCTDTSNFLLISADHLAEGLRQMHVRNLKCGNKKFFIQIPDNEFIELATSYPDGSLFLHNLNEKFIASQINDNHTSSTFDTEKIQYLIDYKTISPDLKFIIVGSNFFNQNYKSKHFSTNFYVPDSTLKFTLNQPNYFDTLFTENVVGHIKGTKNPSEVIVIGAHYDHIGYNDSGIFYGADDNASGTAALIEIARMFSEYVKSGNNLDRTIYFVAFTAEEMGLLGSKFFVQNPTFNLDSCKTMINMDMIGRPIRYNSDKFHVYYLLSGNNKFKRHRNLKKINKEFNNFDIVRNTSFIQKLLYSMGSDHYSFSKKKINTIVFFTDKHSDYHKITDTADKIDFKNLEAIINVIYKYTLRETKL